jgi:nitrogen-specific signal transduction histidine kinase
MALSTKELVRELKHQINSPLAAIRNALYLASVRISDPEIERYLHLANDEVSRIAQVLVLADQSHENKGLTVFSPKAKKTHSAA